MNHSMYGHYGKDYGKPFGKNDIVDMYIDFDTKYIKRRGFVIST